MLIQTILGESQELAFQKISICRAYMSPIATTPLNQIPHKKEGWKFCFPLKRKPLDFAVPSRISYLIVFTFINFRWINMLQFLFQKWQNWLTTLLFWISDEISIKISWPNFSQISTETKPTINPIICFGDIFRLVRIREAVQVAAFPTPPSFHPVRLPSQELNSKGHKFNTQ